MADSEMSGVAEMLSHCGISALLLIRLATDREYAKRIADFMKTADRHPSIFFVPSPLWQGELLTKARQAGALREQYLRGDAETMVGFP